jgi:hypothetical protein
MEPQMDADKRRLELHSKYSALCNNPGWQPPSLRGGWLFCRQGGTAKRTTGAWGWMVLPITPKLEDSLGGATRRSLHIREHLRIKSIKNYLRSSACICGFK